MSFAWPLALLGLLAVPVLFGLRWLALRRRRRHALRLPNLALVRQSVPRDSAWRHRLALGLFAAGLAVLGLAAARPHATVDVSSRASTVLLALDTSRSMCSTDVEPNRLIAAQEAARGFVEGQGAGTRIGLVAFAAFAAIVVEPTTDHDRLVEAIDGLVASRGTAIGQAILASIDAIAETNPAVAPTGVELTPDQSRGPTTYQPETIVVLTDGSNRDGVPPETAAQQAAARGLRVFTIGFGTTEPSGSYCAPDQLDQDSLTGPDQFGGWGGGPGGGGGRMEIDEDTLVLVADLTGGEYFRAEDAKQLSDILLDLPATVVVSREDVDITARFVLPGVLLVTAGIGLSLWPGAPSRLLRGSRARLR